MSHPLSSVVDEFKSVLDRDTRFDMLIEVADRFKEVPSHIATRPFPKKNLVPACESEAYVFCKKNEDQTYKFYFAVENPQGISAKAMAVLLDENLSGKTKEEILSINEEIVLDIFGGAISMGKGQGLMSMIRLVKFLV